MVHAKDGEPPAARPPRFQGSRAPQLGRGRMQQLVEVWRILLVREMSRGGSIMKGFVVSFAIVLGSLSRATQDFAQAATQAMNLHSLPASVNCPVGLTAKRGIGHGGTLAIYGGQRK